MIHSSTLQSDLKLAVYKLDEESDKNTGITKADIALYPDGFQNLKEAVIDYLIFMMTAESIEKFGFDQVANYIYVKYTKIMMLMSSI